MRGQARAASIVSEAIESLRATDWFEDSKLSEEKLCLVLEFQNYIVYLTPQEQRIAF